MNAITKPDRPEMRERISIPAPDIRTLAVAIQGTAPLMICKFSTKARDAIRAKQAEGSTARGKKVREAKDFEAVLNGARHISTDGWDGIPAAAFRNAMISACRLIGFKMTLAKMSVFVEGDGLDCDEGVPLVQIVSKKGFEKSEMMGRTMTGVPDIRVRPLWREWGADLRIRYDADQFTAADVVNLLARAGMQVGVGEGRPDSKQSAGIGFGTFRVVEGE